MNIINLVLTIVLFTTCACKKEDIKYASGDIKITINTGENWIHDFPLFLGLVKKNPPTFAIWAEDTSGNYLSTIFSTYKISTGNWIANKGNRRKESLPYWCHKRGIIYDDGLLLPTKKKPVLDGITGATPKNDKTIQIKINGFTEPIVIKAEFNHSVDFNSFFPENAQQGNNNYSGGKEGSGQPAIIYAATIDPNQNLTYLKLIGRSSSDGNNGSIYFDLEKLTTAKNIVNSISVEIIK